MPETATQPENAGGAASKQTRERSKIEFPYTSLDLAITLAKAVHALGSQCDWAQLGARLDMAADGGGFRQRLMAAKAFGLITYTSRVIALTPLGVHISDPDQEAAAKATAFLSVPLYKAVYEQFRTGTLPGAEGLENAMVVLGVPQKQADKARQAFQRSATEAGFFGYGPNRLVMPTVKQLKSDATPIEHGGGGGGKTPPPPPPPPPAAETDLPPHVQLLVSKLPDEDALWGLSSRKKWLEAALKIFDLVYEREPDDDEQDITITLVPGPTSAK